jgi:hypothetical protein
MKHLSRRTKALTAAAATAAALAATGTGIASAGPTKPATPAAGAQTLGSHTVVAGPSSGVPANGGYVLTSAACPPGQLVLGGGGSNTDGNGNVVITDSRPNGSTGWGVWYKNNGTSAQTVTAWAICGS